MNAIALNLRFDDVAVNDDAAPSAPRVLLLTNDMTAGRGVLPDLVCFVASIAQVATAADAIAAARDGGHDVVVVDFRPDVLGLEAICQLRAARMGLPILFISARSTQDAFDRARSVGADDVLVLPCPIETLERRLTTLASQGSSANHSVIRVGSLALDLATRRAAYQGRPLALSAAEYAVVELLATRNGAPVCKAAVGEALAGSGEAAGLDAFMGRLRRRLATAGAAELIRTVWGQGYALCALPATRRAPQAARPVAFARAA